MCPVFSSSAGGALAACGALAAALPAQASAAPTLIEAQVQAGSAGFLNYGIFTGVALFAVVLNLALWLWLRVRTHLYFAGNVALAGWTLLLASGVAYRFWPLLEPGDPELRLGVSILLANACSTAFLVHLYGLRVQHPRLRGIALGVSLCYLLAVPLLLITGWQAVAAPVHVFIAICQIGALALGAWLSARRPEMRFYAVAFLPVQLNLVLICARHLGLLPAALFAPGMTVFATAIHIVLLTVALARGAQQAEAADKRAQDAALSSARAAERELEARVAERTAALLQANQSLEREVIARQLLQGELQQALASEQAGHAAQKEFVSMVSHEFRNPLAVIDTVAQRMEETLTGRHPDLVASAARMRRSVARLLALIENCLTEDRLSSPYMLPRVSPVDLGQLLSAYFASGRGANERVALRVPETQVMVHADANLIGTAIFNLVDNALKYSSPQHEVGVTLAIQNGNAEISVADRGGGIPLEEQARIFEKFYRAAAAQRVSGAGLGLYLARELAQRHGGDIRLAYSSAKEGTCFVLSLPMPMQAHAAPHALEPAVVRD
jgi:signal transduction histidine kinase